MKTIEEFILFSRNPKIKGLLKQNKLDKIPQRPTVKIIVPRFCSFRAGAKFAERHECYFCGKESYEGKLINDGGWIHFRCNTLRLLGIERELNPVARNVFKNFKTRNSVESVHDWMNRQAGAIEVFNPGFKFTSVSKVSLESLEKQLKEASEKELVIDGVD